MQGDISKEKAQQLDRVEKALKAKFRKAQEMNKEIETVREKEYKPITTAIENLSEKQGDNDYTPITSAIEKLEKSVTTQLTSQLVPFQKAFTHHYTRSGKKPIGYEEDDDGSDSDRSEKTTIFQPELEQQSTPKQASTTQQTPPVMDESNIFGTPQVAGIQKKITLGPIATKFLPRATESVFGMYYSDPNRSYMVGKEKVEFIEDDSLKIGDRTYEGTQGLWRLLTYKQAPDKTLYTPSDLQNYKKILIETDSMYQNNNRSVNKPKSSKGDKWISLVEPIWKEFTTKKTSKGKDTPKEATGSGVLEYNDNNIEYKYINNLNELLTRMKYISAQEQAGNNNFRNEKLAILNFFYNKLEQTIDTPKAMEYMIRIILCMPSKFLRDEKIGSGLFNTILKNIPFEMHAPGYNFLGPGTHLDERLKRGDVGANKLDEAAKQHDIYYRDHQKTTERHLADKVLQEKAWKRFKSNDADMNERFWAFNTAAAMKVKHALGMGIVEPKLKF